MLKESKVKKRKIKESKEKKGNKERKPCTASVRAYMLNVFGGDGRNCTGFHTFALRLFSMSKLFSSP